MEQKLVVAADFGNGKIAMAAAHKQDDGTLELIDFKQVKSKIDLIKDGKIVDVTALASAVTELINQIENDNNLQIGKFHFATAPHTLRSEICKFSIDFSGSQDSDAERLKNDASNHIISDTRRVFGVVQLETGFAMKSEGNFLIVSVQNAVKEKINSINSSTLSLYKPKDFIAPLVEAEQFLTANQKKNGSLLVDFGAGCTSFAVYQNGFPRLCAVVPFGSEHITSDIIKTFRVGKNHADELKTSPKYGLATTSNLTIGEISIKADELKSVISARLKEIFNLIFEEIKNQKIENIKEIVLTGGGSKLRFLPEFLTNFSKTEVKHIDFNIITNEKNKDFINPENSLLLALLKKCNEDCKKIEIKPAQPLPNTKKPPKPPRETIWDLFSEKKETKFEKL